MADDISTVIIPIPSPYQRNFGVHATSYQGAHRMSVRLSEADYKLLQEQAAILGITLSTFVKESAMNMAKALAVKEKSHADEHDLRNRR